MKQESGVAQHQQQAAGGGEVSIEWDGCIVMAMPRPVFGGGEYIGTPLHRRP